jgi:hypothetical protein
MYAIWKKWVNKAREGGATEIIEQINNPDWNCNPV